MELSTAFDTILSDLAGGASILWLALAGVVLIVWDIFRNNAPVLPWLACLVVAGAAVIEVFRLGDPSSTVFFSLVRTGGPASFVSLVILISALCSIVLSVPYLARIKHGYGEVYALILFATSGMVMLGTANNMVTVFVGLETMSIALYILTGLVRKR